MLASVEEHSLPNPGPVGREAKPMPTFHVPASRRPQRLNSIFFGVPESIQISPALALGFRLKPCEFRLKPCRLAETALDQINSKPALYQPQTPLKEPHTSRSWRCRCLHGSKAEGKVSSGAVVKSLTEIEGSNPVQRRMQRSQNRSLALKQRRSR